MFEIEDKDEAAILKELSQMRLRENAFISVPKTLRRVSSNKRSPVARAVPDTQYVMPVKEADALLKKKIKDHRKRERSALRSTLPPR